MEDTIHSPKSVNRGLSCKSPREQDAALYWPSLIWFLREMHIFMTHISSQKDFCMTYQGCVCGYRISYEKQMIWEYICHHRQILKALYTFGKMSVNEFIIYKNQLISFKKKLPLPDSFLFSNTIISSSRRELLVPYLYLFMCNPSLVWSQDQNLTLLFVPFSLVFMSHLTNFCSIVWFCMTYQVWTWEQKTDVFCSQVHTWYKHTV